MTQAVLSGPAAADDQPLPVELVQVAPSALRMSAALTGTIESRDSVSLGFRFGGRVAEVMVTEGDRVTAGDALARTDPLQQDQALRVAVAAQASARAALDQTTAASERAEAMLSRGVGTRAAVDQARQALSQAQGGVERANTAVDQARRAVEDTILRAPADGVVTLRAAEAGQIVGPAQPVIALASLDAFEAVFQIPDAPRLGDTLGAPVVLNVIDMDLPELTGHVSEISPLVNPITGSVELRALIDNAPADAQLLGTAVRGSINHADGTAIQIPWTSLTRHGTRPAVWLIDADGRAHLREITVARFLDGLVVVDEGLSAGDTIAGAGSHLLYPGRRVVAGPGS